MSDDRDIKIAVLEREMLGLREQHKAHKEETGRLIQEIAKSFSDSLGKIHEDIRNIYEFINRTKGGLAVLVLSASVLGGLVVAIVGETLKHLWH